MLRLVIVCFAVMCACPCGTAEEKASSSSAEAGSVADRLLAMEKRIAALESLPFWQELPAQALMAAPAIPLGPAAAVVGPAQVAAVQIAAPPLGRDAPPLGTDLWQRQRNVWTKGGPSGEQMMWFTKNTDLESPGIVEYKAVSARESGGEVVASLPLGSRWDGARMQEIKGELVIDGKDVRVIDAQGKAVDGKDVLGRLAQKRIVGVVILDPPFDFVDRSPGFLKEVPEDTMVILVSTEKAGVLGVAVKTKRSSGQLELNKSEAFEKQPVPGPN